MSWYRSGTVTAAAGQNVITGTGTQWANNVMGVAPGQAFIVQRANGNTLIYEILAVDSNTKIRINGNVVDALSASNYGIQTSVANSYSALARETSAQLALYQQLLQDWQLITTGTGNVSIIAPDGSTVVIPSLAQLSRIGIGLPTQADMANFDWQNFVFTSGANYVTSYNTWVNPPAGITYNAGTRVSIRVIYISTTSGPRMGLELTPDTGAAANFKVYKLLCVGAAGSRVFTFNQDWNSANAVPITGGGTGATTLKGAKAALGIVDQLFTILYPNGTEASPASIGASTRLTVANPFAGRRVDCAVELRVAVSSVNQWGESSWIYLDNTNVSFGTKATPLTVGANDDKYLVIQSGSRDVMNQSIYDGNPHGVATQYTSLPFRLKVWTID